MTRRRRRRPEAARDAFWGTNEAEREAPATIRPTPDPAALLRSLGEPPLLPHATALNHLSVVYEEAVRAATALAAANGLLEEP
jgi:hypothetical protein